MGGDGSLLIDREQWKQLNDDNRRLKGLIENLRDLLSVNGKKRKVIAVAEFNDTMGVVFTFTENVTVKPGDILECYLKRKEG